MSRRNRERKRWKCRGCGTQMHPELASEPVQVMAEAIIRAVRNRPLDPEMLHVCGRCKTVHKVLDGRLVKLTPPELFALHVEMPHTMTRIERMTVPRTRPGAPAGTLVLTEPEDFK